MRKENVLFLTIAAAILLVLIFFVPSYGWILRAWLSPRSLAPGLNDDPGLAAENQALKAQVAEYAAVARELPSAPAGSIRAMVYSSYPLNFKNEITVNAGTDAGVAVGDAATFQGIFVGDVIAVFPESAVIDTVFDSNFKMPVRVGTAGYDALFVGGADPVAGSIAKASAVSAGDIVTTAASGFPYGLPVATVNATSGSPDNLFVQASLSFDYDVNDIQTLLIEK